VREVAALVKNRMNLEAKLGGGIFDCSEVNVSSQVLLAWEVERMGIGTMIAEATKGAGGAGGMVKGFLVEPVIDPKVEATLKDSGKRREKSGKIGRTFGHVAIGEGIGEVTLDGAGVPLEGVIFGGDTNLMPLLAGEKEKRDGEGIENFVCDEGSKVRFDFGRRTDNGSLGLKPVLYDFLPGGKGFADNVGKLGGEGRGDLSRGREDVGGERAVVCSHFEDGEGIGGTVGQPEAVEPGGKKMSEKGADGNTGHKVPFF